MTLAAALAFLALHAPLPTAVTIHQQRCPDFAPTPDSIVSCSHRADGTLFIAPAVKTNQDANAWRAVIAHELGHVWEYQHLDDEARARYSTMIGDGGVDWLTAAGESALQVNTSLGSIEPAEQFADTYALCALGPKVRRRDYFDNGAYFGVSYGRRISRRVLANTCWLLRHPPR